MSVRRTLASLAALATADVTSDGFPCLGDDRRRPPDGQSAAASGARLGGSAAVGSREAAEGRGHDAHATADGAAEMCRNEGGTWMVEPPSHVPRQPKLHR